MLLSWENALQAIQNSIKSLESLSLNIHEALNYILAEDIYAPLPLPPFHKSCMDGYAILKDDLTDHYEIVNTIKAGDMPQQDIFYGQAIKIMTGACLVSDQYKVIPQEEVEFVSPNHIKITSRSPKTHINYRGEFIQKGDLVYTKGTGLNEVVLANLASFGIQQINVYRKPTITLLITGNELLEPGDNYVEGKIYNSNGILLENLLKNSAVSALTQITVADQESNLEESIQTALLHDDILILSGGISVGDFDYTKPCLERCQANTIFHKVNIKPGKPVSFFMYNHKPIFALPGNPVSLFVTFHLFVKPAIQYMQGRNNFTPHQTITIPHNISRKGTKRDEFIPVYLEHGKLILPEYLGSAHLLGISQSNGFILIPEGRQELHQGDITYFIPTHSESRR